MTYAGSPMPTFRPAMLNVDFMEPRSISVRNGLEKAILVGGAGGSRLSGRRARSVAAERDHRIDPRGPAGGHEAGDRRHGREAEGDGDERGRIGRADSVEKR